MSFTDSSIYLWHSLVINKTAFITRLFILSNSTITLFPDQTLLSRAQPDVAAARLAANFVYGVQLGWFSLGGVTYGPDLDQYCGPMGTYDAWMDASSQPLVQFLQLLADSRTAAQAYFTMGRLINPITISPEPMQFSLNANASFNFGYVRGTGYCLCVR